MMAEGRARPLSAVGEVHVFTADLDVAKPDETILSDDELARADRYRFDRDRRRFTAGRTVLRRLIATYLGTKTTEVEFVYGPFGRPDVSDPTLSFNLAEGVSLGEAVDAVKEVERQVRMPANVHGSFQGTAQAFQASLANQPWLILAALVTVYIVLGVLYESYIHPITILSTLPSAGDRKSVV